MAANYQSSSSSGDKYPVMVEIWDGVDTYKARLNIDETLQHIRPTASQITLNSKYPYHIHNGKASYFAGSCTATFTDNENKEDECYDYVTSADDVAMFNYKILEWLHNGETKTLRFHKSNEQFKVGILETVEITANREYTPGGNATTNDKYNSAIKFSWEQIA